MLAAALLMLATCSEVVLGSLVAQSVSVTKSGDFFEVICVGGDERAAELALAVIEPVWPSTCAAFGVRGVRPKELLRVTLYHDVEDYLRADRRLTGGNFQPNQAMSHWSTKSAHVAMQPSVNVSYIEQFGLPMQTQAMLAWEACHIARFELCPNFRAHPGWFQDGLAAAVAQDVLVKARPMRGEQPFFAQRWWRVRRLAERGRLPTASQLLGDKTQDLDMRNRYAARLTFFEFVRRDYAARLVRLAKVIRATVAGTAYAGIIRAAAVQELGGLGEEFREHVLAQRPQWDERSRSLWCDGATWYQAAFAKTDAVGFRAEPVRGDRFEAKGTVWIHPGETQQMNFLFARTDKGWYSLAITAGRGFTLIEHQGGGNQRRVVGTGTAPGCRAGVDVPFSVRANGTDLEVGLATQSWKFALSEPLPGEVYWGVGAQAGMGDTAAGSCGVWRDVSVYGK